MMTKNDDFLTRDAIPDHEKRSRFDRIMDVLPRAWKWFFLFSLMTAGVLGVLDALRFYGFMDDELSERWRYLLELPPRFLFTAIGISLLFAIPCVLLLVTCLAWGLIDLIMDGMRLRLVHRRLVFKRRKMRCLRTTSDADQP